MNEMKARIIGIRRSLFQRDSERGREFARERLLIGMIAIAFLAFVVVVVARSPLWRESGKEQVIAQPIVVTPAPVQMVSQNRDAHVDTGLPNTDVGGRIANEDMSSVVPAEANRTATEIVKATESAKLSPSQIAAHKFWSDWYQQKLDKERVERQQDLKTFYDLGIEKGKHSE